MRSAPYDFLQMGWSQEQYDAVREELGEVGYYALMYREAVYSGDCIGVAMALDSGIPVDAPCFTRGCTALHSAIAKGEAMVRLLLDRGATVNVEEAEEGVPLHRAIVGDDVAVVRLLLERGADPSYRTAAGTPLELAIQLGRHEIVALLKDAGASALSAGEEAKKAGYPSFALLFSGAYYQRLAYMSSLDSPPNVVGALRQAIERSSNAHAEVAALFKSDNWRPQIMAAVAMLLGVNDTLTVKALWSAFDGGSPVSPQLAVTALYRDPAFEQEARKRIEAGCPLRIIEPIDGSAARRWVEPSWSVVALVALVQLCRQLPEATLWLDAALTSDPIRQKVNDPWHGNDQMALAWQEGVAKIPGCLISNAKA